MKKYILDLRLTAIEQLNARHVLLKLTQTESLPMMQPGQFVQVRVDDSPQVYLRRPISIHFVDRQRNELWLLVQQVGAGTQHLAQLQIGATLNVVLPLGHPFSLPNNPERALLVGGGVGIAPLLYLGCELQRLGTQVDFLLGARTKADLLQLDEFARYGQVHLSTEDGSCGERGFVTQHSLLEQTHFDRIATCGPTPMMKAVAAYARTKGIPCEVSLENHMACGIGACLCCVTNTNEGHKCVCTEGPVFNINNLENF